MKIFAKILGIIAGLLGLAGLVLTVWLCYYAFGWPGVWFFVSLACTRLLFDLYKILWHGKPTS